MGREAFLLRGDGKMEKKVVIDSIIEQIRNGIILRRPVIYLQTTELEIVRRVLNSDQVVVRMTRYPADTMVPFAKVYGDCSSGYHDVLIDQRIINMECCTCRELSKKIEGGCGNDGCYGQFLLKGNKINMNYILPSLLAVHIRKDARPDNNASVFDALYPFVDRYQQEEDDSGALRSSIVLLHGEQMDLPAWLMPYCYIVEEPYPGREEIAAIIARKTGQSNCGKLSKDSIESYVSGFLGNTLVQVENTVNYLLNLPEDPLTKSPMIQNESKVQKVLAALKEQNVKSIGLLEMQKIDEKEELGGMGVFCDWLDDNKKSIPRADYVFRRTGAAGHKGVLMCGIPGCGKSAAVNLLAKKLRLPVLRMDIGRLMGGIVGESEHNMHLALRLAEAMSPCILYIDEIEKGFSGSGGRNEDSSGVTKRMFGILLSWMQDCTKPVYIFATANSLSGIPKEFFRSGRFDSHFALYMPTYAECIDIFKKRMKKAADTVLGYDKTGELFRPQCYDDDNLSGVINHLLYEENGQKRGRFITGADITKLVNMALRKFADRKGAISHTEWVDALKSAADETTVYGDGNENLDSIAICYLRMMRLGFQPASKGCLFQPEDYSVVCEEDGIRPFVAEKKNFETDYDSVLYRTIRGKMLFLAARMEEKAVTDLIG